MLDPTAHIFPRLPINRRLNPLVIHPHNKKPKQHNHRKHKACTQAEPLKETSKPDLGNVSISTMNVLDSPFDALVFDVAGYGILTVVNNLWTWVAIITAAVSFWRIRTAGAGGAALPLLKSEPRMRPCNIDLDDSVPQPVAETSATEPLTSPAPPAACSFPCLSVFEDNGITKGKFVAYFDDAKGGDGKGDDDGELTEVGEWGYCGDGDDGFGERWDSWDRVLRLRMGEMGWYSCQDLTAINGNVVRLWDGVRIQKYNSSSCDSALFGRVLSVKQ